MARKALPLLIACAALAGGCLNSGYIQFYSEPTGAIVYDVTNGLQDPQPVGVTPTGRIHLGNVPTRAYGRGRWDLGRAYMAYKKGYRPTVLQPKLSLASVPPLGAQSYTWSFTFDLEPDPDASAGTGPLHRPESARTAGAAQTGPGTVAVTANVKDADVYVGGELAGTVPMELTLKPGDHVIEVRHERYASYVKTVRVLPGSQIAVRAALKDR